MDKAPFIDSLIHGEPDAYRKLIEDNSMSLTSYLTPLLGNSDDAKEIVHEVFVYIWEHRDTLDKIYNLNSYMFMIAKSKAIKLLRKENKFRNNQVNGHTNLNGFANSPDEIIEGNELEMLIRMVIDRMPEMRRKVFILSRNSGLSNEEIAKKLNISNSTVRSHISIALKEIKDALRVFILFFL